MFGEGTFRGCDDRDTLIVSHPASIDIPRNEVC